MAPILTIFGPTKSRRSQLHFEKVWCRRTNFRDDENIEQRAKFEKVCPASVSKRKTNSPLARCVAGCWGGGHVKWCHEVAKPRRNGSGKSPATATISENHHLFIFLKILAKKKTQGNGDSVTQIVAVPEAAKSDTSFMILTFYIFQSFSIF